MGVFTVSNDNEMTIIMEIEEVERMMVMQFDLVIRKKITDEEYDNMSAYPYRKQAELKNKLDKLSNI